MIFEGALTYWIYAHAVFGFVALSIGFIALSSKKGQAIHRRSGKIFAYSMVISSLLSLVIATQPNHRSPFLLCIALLTLYLVIGGVRSLLASKRNVSLTLDYLLSSAVLLSSVFMIGYVPVMYGKMHLLFTIFGVLGVALTIEDFIHYLNPELRKRRALKLHLGKMSGAYIAALTAFVVVNQLIPGVFGWIAPGVLGTFYIIYWNRRVDAKTL